MHRLICVNLDFAFLSAKWSNTQYVIVVGLLITVGISIGLSFDNHGQ